MRVWHPCADHVAIGTGGVSLNWMMDHVNGTSLAGALPVIGLDLDGGRLQIARRGEWICVGNPNAVDDVAAEVRQHCWGDGADLVIEATGIPAVYPMALKLPRGRLVALGSPRAVWR